VGLIKVKVMSASTASVSPLAKEAAHIDANLLEALRR
jgi:hypothetical protein